MHSSITPNRTLRHILTGVTAVLVLVSIVLVATHHEEKCKYTIDSGNTWNSCGTGPSFICLYPAFTADYYQDIVGTIGEINMTCPWMDDTLIVGYIGLILSLLFLILFGLTPMWKSFNLINFLLALAVFTIALLLTTFILMVGDIIRGHRYTDSLLKPSNLTFYQTAYIANAILVFLALLLVVALAIYAFANYRNRSKVVLVQSEVPYQHMRV